MASCNRNNPSQTLPDQSSDQHQISIEQGAWFPGNHRALERWLESVASRDFEVVPVAIFDWDNTCIFNDVGEATFRYQLENLEIKMNPDQLAFYVPAPMDDDIQLNEAVMLAQIRQDILDAYAELWPHIRNGQVDRAQEMPEYRDFRSKVAWLYKAMIGSEAFGPVPAYLWLVGWLSNFSREEIGELVTSVVEDELEQPIGREIWTSATDGTCGAIEYEFRTGIRRHQEMIDLMGALERAGVRVFVVSASGELIVEAAIGRLGYPVEPDNIFGIRLAFDENRLTSRPEHGFPVTYRQGKVELIRDKISPHPIFVAGDADTDFEMFTEFSSLELRLVINRIKQDDDIGALYRAALENPDQDGVVTLLQGRDETSGSFRPSQETISLGR